MNKKDCIEFADWLLQKEVTKHTSMSGSETYVPREFDLLRGELQLNGDKLIQEFIEYKEHLQFKKDINKVLKVITLGAMLYNVLDEE